jgi:hypothetical protein
LQQQTGKTSQMSKKKRSAEKKSKIDVFDKLWIEMQRLKKEKHQQKKDFIQYMIKQLERPLEEKELQERRLKFIQSYH